MICDRIVTKDILQSMQIKKILVCQQRQIGDVLLSTPAVEMLHKYFTEAKIDFFTEKKCLPILEGNPNINKIWSIDKKELSNIFKELAFYRQVASTDYDLIVDFQQLPRSKWVALFSNAKLKVSYPPAWYNRLFYTHWAQPEQAYAATYKAGILEALGLRWQGERPALYLSEAELGEAASILATFGVQPGEAEFLIMADITHRRITRMWPKQHYAKLIDGICTTFPAARVMLTYGPGERDYVESARALCSRQGQVIIPDRTSLRKLGAFMSFAKLHIGNCSAPRHIAVAMGVPSITILGSSSSGWTFPSPEHIDIASNFGCQPCNQNTCPENTLRCLYELLPETVLPKVLEHLQQFCGLVAN